MREDDWISVDDRLPEDKTRVIAYDHDGFGALSARFINGVGWYLEGGLSSNANVTHWRPLPPPPKTTKTDPNQPDLFEETK